VGAGRLADPACQARWATSDGERPRGPERHLLRALDGLSVEGASEGPAAAQHGLGVLGPVGLGRHFGTHPPCAIASGMSASKSYALAYSRPPNGATRASAARLLTNANVKRRIGELRLEAAQQAKASLQVLLPALEERARAAMAAGRMREAANIVGRLARIAAEVNGSAVPAP